MSEKDSKTFLGGMLAPDTGGGLTDPKTTHVDGKPDDTGPADHAPQDIE